MGIVTQSNTEEYSQMITVEKKPVILSIGEAQNKRLKRYLFMWSFGPQGSKIDIRKPYAQHGQYVLLMKSWIYVHTLLLRVLTSLLILKGA